jgi:hypothetical protein
MDTQIIFLFLALFTTKGKNCIFRLPNGIETMINNKIGSYYNSSGRRSVFLTGISPEDDPSQLFPVYKVEAVVYLIQTYFQAVEYVRRYEMANNPLLIFSNGVFYDIVDMHYNEVLDSYDFKLSVHIDAYSRRNNDPSS